MFIDRRQTLAGLMAASLPWPVMGKDVSAEKSYSALALQVPARSVEGAADRAAARAQMLAQIEEVERSCAAPACSSASIAARP